MRFPDFELELAGGGTLTGAELLGRPWIAYLARHPGWSVCQRHLRRAVGARDAIREMDGDLVVVFNAHPRLVASWFRDSGLPGDLTVAADPDATLYEELGTGRTDPISLVAKSIAGGLKSARQGMIPRASRADMLRLGADAAVRADGEVALLHLASSPDDRVPIEDLIAAVRS